MSRFLLLKKKEKQKINKKQSQINGKVFFKIANTSKACQYNNNEQGSSDEN